MPVSYIICAAGLGSRMHAISTSVPKPLLRINGKSLLQWSIDSLPIFDRDQLLLLHSADVPPEELYAAVSGEIKLRLQLIAVPKLTRGQLETASLAYSFVAKGNSVCIFNSDTYFLAPDLRSAMESDNWDGLIPCSVEPGESWSFCVVDDTNHSIRKVTLVTEKRRVSDWCSVGAYWFRDFRVLRELTRIELLSSNLNDELYVAPLYNALIRQNSRIGMLQTRLFRPIGSIEQIEKYWGLTLEKVRAQNTKR